MKYDLVAFDEVAGPNFKSANDKDMYKGYMEQGSFSRGDDKGTVSAEACIIFNGNTHGDIDTLVETSHLFKPLPETIRDDDAFHDRWHAYLPGWEMAKLTPNLFTSHLGFIADYIAEIFHNELRPVNYTDAYERYFSFGHISATVTACTVDRSRIGIAVQVRYSHFGVLCSDTMKTQDKSPGQTHPKSPRFRAVSEEIPFVQLIPGFGEAYNGGSPRLASNGSLFSVHRLTDNRMSASFDGHLVHALFRSPCKVLV